MQTVRQEMITLLSQEEHSAQDLSRILGIRQQAVYDHLVHIARSVASQKKKLLITPPRCLDCGYVFKERKRFTSPSRCPRCKGEHIEKPRYQVI
jgi:predicted Zn-ribbon and HTH transcriptional regulator